MILLCSQSWILIDFWSLSALRVAVLLGGARAAAVDPPRSSSSTWSWSWSWSRSSCAIDTMSAIASACVVFFRTCPFGDIKHEDTVEIIVNLNAS